VGGGEGVSSLFDVRRARKFWAVAGGRWVVVVVEGACWWQWSWVVGPVFVSGGPNSNARAWSVKRRPRPGRTSANAKGLGRCPSGEY
jgi:hypothetical protein